MEGIQDHRLTERFELKPSTTTFRTGEVERAVKVSHIKGVNLDYWVGPATPHSDECPALGDGSPLVSDIPIGPPIFPEVVITLAGPVYAGFVDAGVCSSE